MTRPARAWKPVALSNRYKVTVETYGGPDNLRDYPPSLSTIRNMFDNELRDRRVKLERREHWWSMFWMVVRDAGSSSNRRRQAASNFVANTVEEWNETGRP